MIGYTNSDLIVDEYSLQGQFVKKRSYPKGGSFKLFETQNELLLVTNSPWRVIGLSFSFIRDFIGPAGDIAETNGQNLFVIKDQRNSFLMKITMESVYDTLEIAVKQILQFDNEGLIRLTHGSDSVIHAKMAEKNVVIETIPTLQSASSQKYTIKYEKQTFGDISKVRKYFGSDEFEWILMGYFCCHGCEMISEPRVQCRTGLTF